MTPKTEMGELLRLQFEAHKDLLVDMKVLGDALKTKDSDAVNLALNALFRSGAASIDAVEAVYAASANLEVA